MSDSRSSCSATSAFRGNVFAIASIIGARRSQLHACLKRGQRGLNAQPLQPDGRPRGRESAAHRAGALSDRLGAHGGCVGRHGRRFRCPARKCGVWPAGGDTSAPLARSTDRDRVHALADPARRSQERRARPRSTGFELLRQRYGRSSRWASPPERLAVDHGTPTPRRYPVCVLSSGLYAARRGRTAPGDPRCARRLSTNAGASNRALSRQAGTGLRQTCLPAWETDASPLLRMSWPRPPLDRRASDVRPGGNPSRRANHRLGLFLARRTTRSHCARFAPFAAAAPGRQGRRVNAWLRERREILGAVLLSRVLVLGAAAADHRLHWPHGKVPAHAASTAHTLSILSYWDGVWYRTIAEQGYLLIPGRQSDPAFFPLFPIVLRALQGLGLSFLTTGILVANGAFVIGIVAFYELSKRVVPSEVARTSAMLAAFFPMSFVFSQTYPDTLVPVAFTLALLFVVRGGGLHAAVP